MKRGMFAVVIWMLIFVTPAVAAQKSPKPVHAKPVVSKPVAKTHAQAPKPAMTTHAKSSVKMQTRTHGKPSVKTTTKSSVKTKATVTKTAKTKSGETTATKKSAKTTTTTTSTTPEANTSTASSTTSGTTTLSPVQQKLKKNTNLAAKLQGRLPAGTDLMTAAAGFRNLGQFVSTVNASYNHGLSFPELKKRIVVQGMSLGQASKDMRQTTTTTSPTTTAVRR